MVSHPEVTIRSGAPHTFGWVRRPAFDHRGATAWERPDGQIELLAPGVTRIVRFLPSLQGMPDYRGLKRPR